MVCVHFFRASTVMDLLLLEMSNVLVCVHFFYLDLLLVMTNMCGVVCIFILGRLLSNVLVYVCISIGRPLL